MAVHHSYYSYKPHKSKKDIRSNRHSMYLGVLQGKDYIIIKILRLVFTIFIQPQMVTHGFRVLDTMVISPLRKAMYIQLAFIYVIKSFQVFMKDTQIHGMTVGSNILFAFMGFIRIIRMMDSH